jgi:hypothetical protein
MSTPAPTKSQLTQQLEEMKAELEKQKQANINLQQQMEQSQEEEKTAKEQQSSPPQAPPNQSEVTEVTEAPAPPKPTGRVSGLLDYLGVFSKVRAATPFEGSQDDITRSLVSSWVMEVNNTFNVMGLRNEPDPTNPMKAQLASTLLKAGAMKWWETKTKDQAITDPIYTWKGFQEELFKQYLPVTSFDLAYEKLLSLPETMSKHNHTGDVNSYVNEFRTLLMSIQNRMDDDTQLRLFTRGLHPQIRKELQIHPPKDLEDCMNRAIKSDTIYRVSRTNSSHLRSNFANKRPGGIGATSPYPAGNRPRVTPSSNLNNVQVQGDEEEETAPSYEELLALFQKSKNPQGARAVGQPLKSYRTAGGAPFKKLTPEEREKLSKEGSCFFCRGKGHFARDCSKKQ